jgi:predicted O-methyltransferase YrrM
MTTPPLFQTIDAYIDGLFVSDDDILSRAIERAHAAGLPEHHVSPGQAKLIYLMAKMIGAKRILEIGTLGGYSTVWLARALPQDGELISLELNSAHVKVAQETLADAGFADRCKVIEGKALDALGAMEGPFDLVFIDANKDSYPAYLQHAVRLLRPGGLILADNVVREGKVMEPAGMDSSAIGAAAFNQALAAHPKLEAIILQQVGRKGHDGMAIALVKD